MRRVMRIAVIAGLAMATGCKKDEKKAEPQATGSGSAVTPAPAPTPAPMPTPAPVPTDSTKPPAVSDPIHIPPPVKPADRPASVTEDQVKLADKFIAATEAFAKEVAAAGTDCKKAVAAIKANQAKLAPVVAEAQKLSETVEKDPAAKQWFQSVYIPKMMAAAQIMSPITKACMADPDFKAAAATAMPMGQKKPATP